MVWNLERGCTYRMVVKAPDFDPVLTKRFNRLTPGLIERNLKSSNERLVLDASASKDHDYLSQFVGPAQRQQLQGVGAG